MSRCSVCKVTRDQNHCRLFTTYGCPEVARKFKDYIKQPSCNMYAFFPFSILVFAAVYSRIMWNRHILIYMRCE
ncbi:hypothetical protein HanIR_Chr06g0290181 [Helianthus annuus]|nr:hypothetical protein HanIR_Chr06g0290181 [Helianthus annuus]